MCLFGDLNLTIEEFIQGGHSFPSPFPLTCMDYLTFSLSVVIAVLGFGLNCFINFVLVNSDPSFYDLVLMNLALADTVSPLLLIGILKLQCVNGLSSLLKDACFPFSFFLHTTTHTHFYCMRGRVRPSVHPSVPNQGF